jgi:beta-galactosidase
MRFLKLLLLFNFCFLSAITAQERLSATINSNWLFFKGDTTKKSTSADWERVSIPHTWNDKDVMDDEPGYYRGDAWYKKTIYVPSGWKEKEVYIFFEGAAQVAEVFINGKKVGMHVGSYTFFRFPISKYLNYKNDANTANELLVKLNNSHDEQIAPLSGDYTFFGGIYRDVYLQAFNKVHFDADNNASDGIFITTPSVTNNAAVVNVKGAFVNKSSANKSLVIKHQVFDAEGKLFVSQKNNFKVKAGQKINFNQEIKNIRNHKLWSVEEPYLYRIVSTITDLATNQKLDEVSNPLGFRWYHFDAVKGFFLNGKHVKLIGASRHQDFKGLGNALTDAMHVRDVELLKEMGGNFLRIAHYPQDPAILQACDRLGILASVETPMGNQITESEAFADHSKGMFLEMVLQNYNHPSLVIWSYMNEVLLRPPYEKGSAQQEAYFKQVTKLAQALENIARTEDPQRYTMIANHGNFDLYNKVQLTTIPKLVGWNLYKGWYSGDFDDFGKFLDRHHQVLPNKPVLVTEYGSDADVRLHNFNPVRFDKTVEYTTDYHQAYLKAMMDRPFVAAGMIWNLAEFSSESRSESTPHVNAKGILTHDRKPKDGYRFYQANLLKEPFVQIGTKEWSRRTGFIRSANDRVIKQPVLVFSNQKNVSLRLNGEIIGAAATVQGVARFIVPFTNGINRLTASASADGIAITDQADIHFDLLSQDLKSKDLPFKELNISLGDQRTFDDEFGAQTWLPEQSYKAGSWGYVGGEVYKMDNTSRHSYGSDKNIVGTDLDPVYATQRVGIQQFKFDVPDGDYEVVFHFAELISNIQREELAYNLGSDNAKSQNLSERSFDVRINGKEALAQLSNAEYLIPEHAVSFKFTISVSENEGITADFTPIKGQTILNGIQIRKLR